MSEQFLLMKRGLYYMPNDCGYTGIKDHAGRYSRADTIPRVGNGVAAIEESKAPEFASQCYDDLARNHLTKQRDEARAEVARLRSGIENVIADLENGWEGQTMIAPLYKLIDGETLQSGEQSKSVSGDKR